MVGRESGRQRYDGFVTGGSGTLLGGIGQFIRGGGEPPGSEMDFDPRNPVVMRCGSLPIGMRQ